MEKITAKHLISAVYEIKQIAFKNMGSFVPKSTKDILRFEVLLEGQPDWIDVLPGEL